MFVKMLLIGGAALTVGALVQGDPGTPPALAVLAFALHWLGGIMIATALLFALIEGVRAARVEE